MKNVELQNGKYCHNLNLGVQFIVGGGGESSWHIRVNEHAHTVKEDGLVLGDTVMPQIRHNRITDGHTNGVNQRC